MSLVVCEPGDGPASKMSGSGGPLRAVTPPSRVRGPNGHRTLVRSSCQQRVPRLTPPDKIRHSVAFVGGMFARVHAVIGPSTLEMAAQGGTALVTHVAAGR